jgi:outer membrane protein
MRGASVMALAAGAFVAALAVPATADAQERPDEGQFMVRARLLYMVPSNQSSGVPALGVPRDQIHVSQKVFPEIDFSYFITPNFAAELVLTYPQEHDVKIAGAKAGTVQHLPPTLLAQYHFTDLGRVKPYVGAGINLTLFMNDHLSAAGLPLKMEKVSVGPALQVGADVRIQGGWYANLDIKKVWIDSDVKLKGAGTKVAHTDIDPWLFSVGIGYRF